MRSPRSGVFIHLETEDPKVCCNKPSGKWGPIHSCGVFSNLEGEEPEVWCIQSPGSPSFGVFSHLEIEKPEVWWAPSSCPPSRNCLEPVVSLLSLIVLASENNLQRFSRTIYPQTIIIWFNFHHLECALLFIFSIKPDRHVLTRIYTIQRPNGVLYCTLHCWSSATSSPRVPGIESNQESTLRQAGALTT